VWDVYIAKMLLNNMSLLPVVRHSRLYMVRNVPRHSPIFRLLDVVQYDDLGKYLGYSTHPNCRINDSIVTAKCDIAPGTALTVNPFKVHIALTSVNRIGAT